MSNKLRQLWLAIRIWLMAIATNAVLGAFFLAGFSFKEAADFIYAGLLYGAIFSMPVMGVLYYLIKYCVDKDKSGSQIFRTVIAISSLATVIMFIVFWSFLGIGADPMMFPLLGIALLSGVIAISTQYRSFKKMGSDFNTVSNV